MIVQFSGELCRQSFRDFFWLNCIYPHLSVLFHNQTSFLPDFCLEDLSVALLITFLPLFSFQGANLLRKFAPSTKTSFGWCKMRCNQDSSLAPYFAYAVLFHKTAKRVVCASRFLLVGLRGLEPPTSRLSGVRSNHLSYKPMLVSALVVVSVFRRPLVEMRRIELLTPCLQGRCSPS